MENLSVQKEKAWNVAAFVQIEICGNGQMHQWLTPNTPCPSSFILEMPKMNKCMN